MNPSLEPALTSAEAPRRVPRFLSCLVKGPLGCLCFALGAAGVFVVLLPPALGRVLDRFVEGWFAEHHAGSLELSDAWLGSFYNRQRVERLILRDPGGDEILRGELSAPSLAELFDDRTHPFGPIVVRIDLLHLAEDEDGTTNLERALEETREETEDLGRERGLSTDVPFRFELAIVIARLRTSSARGKDAELQDLTLHGTLEWGPEETHLALEGGADPSQADGLHTRVDLRRSEFGPRRPWASALVLERAPSVLVRALCSAVRPMLAFAGERTERLSWSRDGQEVAFSVEDEGVRFELLGEENGGIVSGPEGSAVAATLPCTSAPGRALLTRLLPLATALECADPGASHELRLTDYRWPLDGDWAALSGELELGLAPSYATVAPWGGEFGATAALATLSGPLRLGVRDGILEYARFELPLERGWLRIDGNLEIASEQCDFIVSGERDGDPIDPVRLIGARDALVPTAPELPPVPGVSEVEIPTPPR